MVGSGGRVTRWDGLAWIAEPTTTLLAFHDVLGVGDTLWAVGEGGLIARRPLP